MAHQFRRRGVDWVKRGWRLSTEITAREERRRKKR
jgi:hypothetical protein